MYAKTRIQRTQEAVKWAVLLATAGMMMVIAWQAVGGAW
ncbi:hypothetical protein Enr8_46870 [Blastopirellula retiformator]|uniref:Uncharacterized protein n=1 Tax=Blastopirellula retiformator TaxID=2527970 RepID=A0A5C5UWT2_9BACT|nr:hypothetical protein Enr8_46870 [Blastopirellula retiformator]